MGEDDDIMDPAHDHLERDCDEPYEPDESMDGDFDSAMASAGHGTDEDYGYAEDVL